MPSFLRRLIGPMRVAPVATSETITLRMPDGSDVAVLRVRHPRARRIKLSISERGVRLTLPMRASLRAADAFLAEHRDWLAAQLPRWIGCEPAAPFERGSPSLPLRGEVVPVAWELGRYARVRREAGGMRITLPECASDASLRRALREFYLAEARADIGRWMPTYLPSFPRAPATIRLRPLASLWGSLSAGDALSLDLSLVLGDPAAFEYVLVHELCHLVHRHHKRAFWREVEARGADWRAQRAYLHSQGAALKGDLRRLLGKD